MQQQNPDALPSHSRNQSSFDGFLGYQPHGPAGAALWRITANHGDNALPLAVFQQIGRSGPLLFIECAFEAPLPIAMADLPNRLRR